MTETEIHNRLLRHPEARREGELVLVRAIRPSDAANLQAFHARCSAETQYRRFLMHKPHLSDKETEYFCNVDMRDRGAVVATDPRSRDRIHGIGQWDALGGGRAEIAFVVEDDLQGVGVGRRLLKVVLDHTRALGFRHLTGSILAGNGPMRRLFETCGYAFGLGEIRCGDQSFSLIAERGETDHPAWGEVRAGHLAFATAGAPTIGHS